MVFWPAVNGEGNAPYGGFDYDSRDAQADASSRLEGASRAIELKPEQAAKAYGMVGRTSDGRDIKLAPSQKILDAIKDDKG